VNCTPSVECGAKLERWVTVNLRHCQSHKTKAFISSEKSQSPGGQIRWYPLVGCVTSYKCWVLLKFGSVQFLFRLEKERTCSITVVKKYQKGLSPYAPSARLLLRWHFIDTKKIKLTDESNIFDHRNRYQQLASLEVVTILQTWQIIGHSQVLCTNRGASIVVISLKLKEKLVLYGRRWIIRAVKIAYRCSNLQILKY